MKKSFKLLSAAVGLLIAAAGCTVHPAGEMEERRSADLQGATFQGPIEQQKLPPLPANPDAQALVNYALLASPDLQQRYWEWRSAIEQIPQDGTQQTNLVLSAGVPITRGSTGFNQTTVTIANDPMADIVWPSKLGVAATRALENAKAAGYRFQKAQYELRQKVLDAYYDYELAAQMLELDRADEALFHTSATVLQANISSGKSSQSDSIKAQNETDLMTTQITEQEARLPALIAAINTIIGRDPAAPLAPATDDLLDQDFDYNQDQLLHQATTENPELAAIDAESHGKLDAIQLAKLEYLPDFSLSASSDLAGNVQNLLGTLTVPLLRYQAINAAIAQAQANLQTSNAMRRQTQLDVRQRVVGDVAFLIGIEKTRRLFSTQILPRAQQNVEITRESYETGRNSLSDFFDAQRSVLAVKRLVLELNVDGARQKADLEAVIAKPLI